MAGDAQPETELCRLEVDGAVANVTLDRTDAFNALNPQLISDISEILEWTSRRSVGTTGELHSSDGSPNLRRSSSGRRASTSAPARTST